MTTYFYFEFGTLNEQENKFICLLTEYDIYLYIDWIWHLPVQCLDMTFTCTVTGYDIYLYSDWI